MARSATRCLAGYARHLHMWTQIVGKVRLALSPPINHWWEVPLYISARGLTTSSIPYGRWHLRVEFDFIEHHLTIQTSEGRSKTHAIGSALGCRVLPRVHGGAAIFGHRSEDLEGAMRDPQSDSVRSGHAAYLLRCRIAHRFWRILILVGHCFSGISRSLHRQKQPGTFLLGKLRSGGHPLLRTSRAAPRGRRSITREAYSHEVISAGFWPGGGDIKGAAFYSYTAPAPPGLADRDPSQHRLSSTRSCKNSC